MDSGPWTVLGVAADADDETVRAAYLRLARETHPDLGGSEHRFREVCAAYEELSGPDRPFASSTYGGESESDYRADHDSNSDADGAPAASYRSVADFLRKKRGMSASEWQSREEESAHNFQEHLRTQRDFASRAATAGRSGWLAPDPELNDGEDEWEMGHGLGRYGTGPESVYLKYGDYYRKAADAARREERAGGEGKHEAFWRRRRESRRLHSVARHGSGSSGAVVGTLWRRTGASAFALVRRACPVV